MFHSLSRRFPRREINEVCSTGKYDAWHTVLYFYTYPLMINKMLLMYYKYLYIFLLPRLRTIDNTPSNTLKNGFSKDNHVRYAAFEHGDGCKESSTC